MKRTDIEDIYALSPAQQGMLFEELEAPSEGRNTVQILFTLEGRVNQSAIVSAIALISERHPALRTSFHWERAVRPLQVVQRRSVEVPLTFLDWRGLTTPDQHTRVRQLLSEDRHCPFTLTSAPLLRLTLVQINDNESQLLVSYHHLLFDGWSLPLLFAEILTSYEALARGEQSHLPPPPRPFRDYILWLQQQDPLQSEHFWRDYLRGFTSPTPLPLATSRLTGTAAKRDEQHVWLTREATAKLEAFARSYQLTLNTVVQGAWAVLLWRYSGTRDIIFGAAVSGRPPDFEGVERMLGLFMNVLPVRVEISDMKVCAWLRGLQERNAEARQYEYTLLSQVQRWSEVGAGQALFDSLMAFENYPVDRELYKASDSDAILRVAGRETVEHTNFPLTLAVAPGKKLGLRVGFDASRITPIAIERVCAQLMAILESMADHADRSVLQLPALIDAERRLLDQWNDTYRDYKNCLCVPELFERAATLEPEAVAVVWQDRQLTYAELDARSNQLARHLHALGVEPESRVCILLRRSDEVIVSLLGVLKAGAAYVPLDPEYPRERIEHMLEDCGAAVIVSETALRDQLTANAAVPVVFIDAEREQIAQESIQPPDVLVHPENLAYVIYTSGSTGKPKGVAVQHAALRNLLYWHQERYGLSPGDKVTNVAGQAFDASLWEIWPCLTSGASLHVLGAERAGTPDELCEWLIENEITHCFLPTPFAETLLPVAESAAQRTDGRRLSLKQLWAGGDALRRRPKVSLPFAFDNVYGPTECTIASVVATVEPEEPERIDRRIPPIGRPVANTQIYVLDERGELAPIGARGEIHIGGHGVARGYVGQAWTTAEQFIPDPFGKVAGARLYRTGDLGRWLEDGNLEFLSRIDEQVKIRGQRVEPAEVQAVLCRHPAVSEALVMARELDDSGKSLVAYVVPHAGASIPARQLFLQHLRVSLPEYMMPAVFVPLDRMPLTPNGKIDRHALPAPENPRERTGHGFVPLRTPVEEVLAEIWSELLPVETVGPHDDFFELGGHSLLAIQLAVRIKNAFGLDLALPAIFDAPTLAGLAAHVERSLAVVRAGPDAVEEPPITRVVRPAHIPLSLAQQRIWSSQQMQSGAAIYNITVAARLNGDLQVAILRQTFNELIKRHESLRTGFRFEHGHVTQVIADPLEFSLPCIDLADLDESERSEAITRLGQDEARRPFDLESPPLLRALLLRLNQHEHILLLVTHHIVSDAWSLGILLGETASLYTAFAAGHASPLPELPIQYADYALWQQRRMSGAVLESQLEYWKRTLCDPLPVLTLSTKQVRPEQMTFNGARELFAFSEDLTGKVKALSRQTGATLFMTLLTAFKALIHRRTGQDDVIVGTPLAGRGRLEVEGLVGCFINTLPLRTDLSGDPTFRELIKRVRETTLGAYAHGELPFERLVEELRPARDPSRTAFFQVTFGMQNAPLRAIELPGLNLQQVSFDNETARFDLTVWVIETRAGLRAAWTYNTDLFDSETVRRLHTQYENLLRAAVAHPDVPLSNLEMQSAATGMDQHATDEEFAKLSAVRFTRVKPRLVSVG